MNLVEAAYDYERRNGHFGWAAEKEDFSTLGMLAMRMTDASFHGLTDVDINALPETLNVAQWMDIENQGSVGSCAGHARTSCQELAYRVQTKGKVIQLNRMFAYLQAQKRDGIHGDNGSTISGHAECAKDEGTPREELWRYQGRYPAGGYGSIPSDKLAELLADAANYRIRTWKELKSYSEVLGWIVNGIGGVDIGIQWSLEPDSRGCIERYSQRGGGHSIALLDWNKKFRDSQGRPYIELFNSWGKEWGFQGRCWVHPDVIEQWCQRQTVIGLSDMVDIKPRPFDWKTESFFAKRSLAA